MNNGPNSPIDREKIESVIKAFDDKIITIRELNDAFNAKIGNILKSWNVSLYLNEYSELQSKFDDVESGIVEHKGHQYIKFEGKFYRIIQKLGGNYITVDDSDFDNVTMYNIIDGKAVLKTS